MGALQDGDHVPFMPIFTTADQGESVPAIAGPESSNNAVAIPIMPRLIMLSIAFLPVASSLTSCPLLKHLHHIRHFPKTECYPCGHRGRHPQRPMTAHEIVMHECDRNGVVLGLLGRPSTYPDRQSFPAYTQAAALLLSSDRPMLQSGSAPWPQRCHCFICTAIRRTIRHSTSFTSKPSPRGHRSTTGPSAPTAIATCFRSY